MTNFFDELKKQQNPNHPVKRVNKLLSGMTQDDTGFAKGEVTITAEYKDGKKKTLFKESNLVVRLSGEIMADFSLGSRTMSYIELGNAATPTAPTLDDVSLEASTGVRKAVTGVKTGSTVVYETQFLNSEGNGFTFTEAGLFSSPFSTGLLFARKIFDPIPKDNTFALTFKWAITYGVLDENNCGGCQGIQLIGNSTITFDQVYTAVGGESQIVITFDFTVGAKQVDVILENLRLIPGLNYFETNIGPNKGIQLIGWTPDADDVFYFVNRKLA